MIKKISTTALSKKLKTSKNKLDQILISLKYITKIDEKIELTELGKKNSGEYKKDKRFGTYIIWNENINIEIKNKKISNKEKGDIYEEFIAKHFEARKYHLIRHGKEKGIKDGGIDLIAKKGKEILFIQCKNWKENGRKVTHKEIKVTQQDVTNYMNNNPLYNSDYHEQKILYVMSKDILEPNAYKYIQENNNKIDFMILDIK